MMFQLFHHCLHLIVLQHLQLLVCLMTWLAQLYFTVFIGLNIGLFVLFIPTLWSFSVSLKFSFVTFVSEDALFPYYFLSEDEVFASF